MHTQTRTSKRAYLCPHCLAKRSFMARIAEYVRFTRCDACRRITKAAACVRALI